MSKSSLEIEISGRKSRTSHAQVVDEIGRGIISGQYAVGTTLPGDQELAQRFKVSRTVLREAMKTLAAKGLIVPRARIGTKVTPASQWNLFDGDVLTWHFHKGVDQEFLKNLTEIRLAFEPFAAGLASENADDKDIARLYQLADEMGNPAHTPGTLAAADLKFHLAIADASRNPFMRTVGSLIEAALVGIFRLSSPDASENRMAEVSATHRRIVDAIAKRDREASMQAMRDVINAGQERVRSVIR